MPDFRPEDFEKVYFSGKEAEEIGFGKFHQRQAQLRGIHVLVLDHMRIRHTVTEQHNNGPIGDICSEIMDLDLSSNLFSSLEEVADICAQMPKLRVLTLDGNRFVREAGHARFDCIKTLSLVSTLLEIDSVQSLLREVFPSLARLNLGRNGINSCLGCRLPSNIRSLDLSENDFTYLVDLRELWADSDQLETLILKHNHIALVTIDAGQPLQCPVKELDLSYNAITDFTFFNSITPITFPNLTHLRVTGNPLYQSLVSAEGKSLTPADGYMLTIARLSQLEYLNYSKITEKERLNAETYYLGQIAIELANAPENQMENLMRRHPRYKELCDEYGEPAVKRIERKDVVNPNTLAARLISVTFMLSSETLPAVQQRSWTEEIPKAFPIYAVLGLVGKRLQQLPLDLRLILETNERDPVGSRNAYDGPEWWDSSDEEDDEEGEWVKREVELVAGTRALATYIESHEVTIRVHFKPHER